MTHNPLLFEVMLIGWAFIFLLISGLPAGFALAYIHRFNRKFGWALSVLATPIWLAAWAMGSWLWARHGKLQQQAAREAGCMGYGEGMFPDRCVDVMNSAGVIPEGYFAWSSILFGFAVVGLGTMFLQANEKRFSKLGAVISNRTDQLF